MLPLRRQSLEPSLSRYNKQPTPGGARRLPFTYLDSLVGSFSAVMGSKLQLIFYVNVLQCTSLIGSRANLVPPKKRAKLRKKFHICKKNGNFSRFETQNVRYCILFWRKSNLTPLETCLTTSFGELLFKIGKALFQLLNGYTQEAISSLQLPTTLEQPAKVSRCRLWTEVGLTLLRACPIFFVTSCDFALGSGFRGDEHARTMRDKKSPSAKSGAKLQNKCPITLDSFKKNAKNLHFFTKSGKIGSKITRFRSNLRSKWPLEGTFRTQCTNPVDVCVVVHTDADGCIVVHIAVSKKGKNINLPTVRLSKIIGQPDAVQVLKIRCVVTYVTPSSIHKKRRPLLIVSFSFPLYIVLCYFVLGAYFLTPVYSSTVFEVIVVVVLVLSVAWV